MENKLFSESPELGYGVIGIGLVGCSVLWYNGASSMSIWALAIIIVLILIALLYFYRNPYIDPSVTYKDSCVIAPSYGTVSTIIRDLIRNTVTICIFLSPLDIHQQYYPINGTVTSRVYDATGKFELAYEMDKSRDNEKKIHTLATAYGPVIVTQIAGWAVRSIVSDESVGVPVTAGHRFGMIKFGSRVDLVLPFEDKLMLHVEVGDKLTGGSQIIGCYT